MKVCNEPVSGIFSIILCFSGVFSYLGLKNILTLITLLSFCISLKDTFSVRNCSMSASGHIILMGLAAEPRIIYQVLYHVLRVRAVFSIICMNLSQIKIVPE